MAGFLEQTRVEPAATLTAEQDTRLTISTIHGAKGTEAQVVFVIGCEERLLPTGYAIDSGEPLRVEEKRRLFYVAATRARGTARARDRSRAPGHSQQGLVALRHGGRPLSAATEVGSDGSRLCVRLAVGEKRPAVPPVSSSSRTVSPSTMAMRELVPGETTRCPAVCHIGRMRITRVVVMCAFFVVVGTTSAFGLSNNAHITHTGLGPVKLGMTERQIERVGKRPIKLDYSAGSGSSCAQAKLVGKTYGLFTDKRLRRIYIRTRAFATKTGVRVGSSEAKVLAAYPNMLARAPQFYTPDEDNLILIKGNRKLVFSLTDGEVSEISTGRKPEIDYVEGCA